MAGQVVQMDYEQMQAVSNMYKTSSETLRTVAKALEVAITLLRVSAMLGNFMAPKLIKYLENIKKKCLNLAKICDEFSEDLARAVGDHKKGDIKGKRYFGEGVR